jgi:REP element-mobilizing transposase RayT
MQARQIIPGATYMITRRCTQRQFLLVPRRRTVELVGYCLAYAIQRTGVIVHAVIFMSNHYHIVVTDPHGVLPAFVECLNKLIAKCVNASLGRWENLWASEQASYVRLLDAEAVIDKIAYALSNPVQAGLVKRGEDWPGVRHARPGSYVVRRPDVFFRDHGSMPKTVKFEIATPSLDGLSRRDAQACIDEAVAQREATERARILREGGRFLGASAVKRQDPFESPTTREPRRQLSPRVASRNKWRRIETLARCADFARDYRDALAAWCAQKRSIIFPVGTYLMRLRHQVRCAEA